MELQENKTICSPRQNHQADTAWRNRSLCSRFFPKNRGETKAALSTSRRESKIFRLGLPRCLEKIEVTGNFRFAQTYAIDPRQKLAEDGILSPR